MSQAIAEGYEAQNEEADRQSKQTEESAADQVLRMYGFDDPLKDLELINAEKARLQGEREMAIERQRLTKENATQQAEEQRALYEFELDAVEKERLTQEALTLDAQTAKALERLEAQRAANSEAEASNDSFAKAREVIIKNNEKKSDAKREIGL